MGCVSLPGAILGKVSEKVENIIHELSKKKKKSTHLKYQIIINYGNPPASIIIRV